MVLKQNPPQQDIGIVQEHLVLGTQVVVLNLIMLLAVQIWLGMGIMLMIGINFLSTMIKFSDLSLFLSHLESKLPVDTELQDNFVENATS